MLPQIHGKLGVVAPSRTVSVNDARRTVLGQWSNLAEPVPILVTNPSTAPLPPTAPPGYAVPEAVPAVSILQDAPGCRTPMTPAGSCATGSSLYVARGSSGSLPRRICVKN